ncbi:MAG: hypothetical protein II280_03905 [Lachnospiraceae bacterium]|nr:hypothetical protein [Lachnospiraceae bacterium]
MNELLNSWWAVPAMDKMLWRAGDRAMDLLDELLARRAIRIWHCWAARWMKPN